MAPSRRKGSGRASATASRHHWKAGDLVLAKMKGFPPWPAMVSEPEKWGYSSDRKKLLVYFYGTKDIAFCNYGDVEVFTEEKKKSLVTKRQGKGADFVRAVEEIVDIYEKLKRQNQDKFNSGDEGTVSSSGNSEGAKSKSFNRSPELSSDVTNNSHQSEALCVMTESHDVLNPEEVPETSIGDDLHDAVTEMHESTGTISILEQLRKTPLTTAINSRKRLIDAPLKSSAIQRRVTSLRRSRSSSGQYLYKFQKSAMMIDDSTLDGGELLPDSAQEESTLKEEVIGEVPHISFSSIDVRPGSGGLPFNVTSEDILSETASLNSEVINLNEGSKLESDCKVEHLEMGYSEVDRLNGDFKLNNKLDVPVKTVIIKRKRKPNRKRVAITAECAKYNQEAESQVHPGGSLLDSPYFHNEKSERSHSVDGDEHLPLVKRARVRMNKPPVEEVHLDEIVAMEERSDTTLLIDNSDKYIASSSSENTCPDNTTSSSVKEALISSPVGDCILSSGKNMIIWKSKEYPLKGIALDVEAALPPSKRLHRALEAMSANAAEAIDNCTESPRIVELVLNDNVDPSKSSPLHVSTGEIIGGLTESGSIEPSDSNAVHSSASVLPSCLTSHNVEVHIITPSESKPDNENFISSSNKDDRRIVVDGKNSDESYISKMSDKDVLDKSLRPCSFTEKQKIATSSEGISDELPSCESISDQLSSPLGEENVNPKQHPTKKCHSSRVDSLDGDETVRSFVQSVSDSKQREDFLTQNGAAAVISSSNPGSMTSDSSGVTNSSNTKSIDNNQARDMLDVAEELKADTPPKDRGVSPDLTPMKDLIAAAQAKRLLSRSTSFYDSVDDDSMHLLQNGSRNPIAGLHQKGLNKFPSLAEANTARKTFEALLCTLSRTKESIGRATRLAIDCAKFGIAGEVVEILLQNLERESSLYKRVDLFFLVDSITQCSRCQKGGAGDVYPSLVQPVLSHLLTAAAPPGNAAWENRRQCLKVLKVWLERKTLPESIVLHHMRELETANEASFTSTYSRRPPRTERSLNDPVREMDGMLVDEYGSNTSFQLPSFLHPRVFDDEEGSSDDERSFEAVTPEQDIEVDDAKEATHASTERHRHVLEDVDGELEMEDLAPPCEVEVASTCHDTVHNTHYQLHHHHPITLYAPPLPEDKPPSPPPLPSSPPPLSASPSTAPPCHTPLSLFPQHQSGVSHALADVADFHLYHANNLQNQPQQSICQQPNNLDTNLLSSGTVSYSSMEYAGPPERLPPAPSLTSSTYPVMHTGKKNNVTPLVSVPAPNKAYHLQPPPPTVSNQFSYVQAEPRQTQQQTWGNCSSLPDRFQYVHDNQRGNFCGDRGTREPAVPLGSVLSDKVEPSTIPCRGWSLPPRPSSYHVPASRQSLENPVSRVAGAPGYWRPS